MIPGEPFCGEYTVVKEDPLTLDEGKDLPLEQCPKSVFGFSDEDTGAVFQWIRDAQRKYKEKQNEQSKIQNRK